MNQTCFFISFDKIIHNFGWFVSNYLTYLIGCSIVFIAKFDLTMLTHNLICCWVETKEIWFVEKRKHKMPNLPKFTRPPDTFLFYSKEIYLSCPDGHRHYTITVLTNLMVFWTSSAYSRFSEMSQSVCLDNSNIPV